ncbi:hypothetical protein EHQ24_00060 [Leptospira noumeaensis]|uniref:Uncharacterized protein n=1 Tax=Leptospira noumeaensis TaxID=2484964 RepID=A0A4R9IK67_9LEPT|nr:hypothetical protein [Leptospira noumeaensis]TGK89257.1 hypothetical protein EHQ24_00060 [Leptospira noumeaensis]
MEKFINFLKSYYLLIVIFLIVSGVTSLYFSSDYELNSKNIQEISNGQIVINSVFVPGSKKYFLEITGNFLITFAITIFISLFFVNFIDKIDKDKFENKLLDFQKDTAKNAILSTFERLIEPEFFNIIKNEILNLKLLRTDCRWQYDIEEETNGLLILTRTISYKLKNISNEVSQEPINIIYSDNTHTSSEIIELKSRADGEDKFTKIEFVKKGEGNNFKQNIEIIEVKANSSIEIILILKQTFKNKYIFETHISRYPIINLEIIVNLPKDFSFSLSADTLSSPLETHVDTARKKTYQVKGAIYKGQGIEFFAEKIKNDQ